MRFAQVSNCITAAVEVLAREIIEISLKKL